MSGTPDVVTSLEDLRKRVFQPERVTLEDGSIVEIQSVPKSLAMQFADRLETMSGASQLYDIAADMVRAAVRLELTDDEALALYNLSGGMTGDLFSVVARRCGVADHVRVMVQAMAAQSGEDPTGPGTAPG